MGGYIDFMKKQFPEPFVPDPEEPEKTGPDAPEPINFVQDVMEDASQLWQWAGIGFGQQELYRLQKSLKRLVTETSAERVRFFGVIKGTEKDYYIAEGEDVNEEDAFEPKDPNAEPKGQPGVNKNTYWVTSSTIDPWVKLPNLEPKDIAAARAIKVLFTGDLQREIHTNPNFFGKEEIYLRAQIARISASTTLCAANKFKLQSIEEAPLQREPEPNNDEEDNPVPAPSTLAMNSMEMWVHEAAGILAGCHKTNHTDEEPPEAIAEAGVDAEEWMNRIRAQDPFDPRLKSIGEDKKVAVSKSTKICPWIVKLMGDATEYAGEGGKKVCNGVVVVRSLQWPGAYNFYQNGQVQQIYVGSGHKYEEASYFPVQPPTVNDDPDEYEDMPEPTPLEEPVADEKPADENAGSGGEGEE